LDTAGLNQDSTFRVGPLVNLTKLLVKLGCESEPLIERAGFRREDFEDTENRIPYVSGSRLLADCVAATDCDHFGLLLGQMAGPSYLGVAGFLASTAATVGQALQALVENLDLHDEGAACSLQIEDEYCQLSFSIHEPGVSAIAQIHDMSVVIMCEIMRAWCGREWNASQVHLLRKEPPDLAPHIRYFRTAVLFDAQYCGIVFPNHNLQLKPPAADEFLHQHLEQEACLLHQMQHQEIMEMLPAVIQRCLLQDQCKARDIADAFGIQERTLHRRLKSAGTSFRHELDSVRESLSIQLLNVSDLPVYDIATSLGYADSSGFIRAFRRWTGSSPASWRRQNQPR